MQIGPLTFPAVIDDISEPLGDGVDQVGAVVVAAERRARQLDLKLSVRGEDDDPDARAAGLRLRRQVRALMENVEWRKLALPVTWDVDPDLDVWLTLGSGDLSEAQAGLTFGEFTLQLTGYIVGRPGGVRAARRLDLTDRRDGTIARDTFGTIYSTDFADHPAATSPLYLPGDITAVLGAAAIPTVTAGPTYDGRTQWASVPAIDGEVVSYMPDPAIGDEHGRHALLDEPGSVRVWDIQTPGSGMASTANDWDLADLHNWERVVGPTVSPSRPLTIDNGLCRLLYLGSADGILLQGRATGGNYFGLAQLLAGDISELSVVELTPERAVVEYRAVEQRLRVVLQRGWNGPRIEVLSLTTDDAWLELDGVTPDTTAYDWMWDLTGTSAGMRVAASHEDVGVTDTGTGTLVEAPRSFVLQTTAGGSLLALEALGALSLIDARPIPVLVER